jgi:EmrB/QacA subfamily drug resistance transporter
MPRSTYMALGAMALGVFVIANDFTALSVAVPEIESDLDADLTTAQWVINGYALVFGVLIVTGGRLADMLGRRRTFLIGCAIFAAFSAFGGLAPNAELLILCRAMMGIGGALMWPAVLGMTYAVLPDDKAGLAGGLILGVAGFGNAIGPLYGGFLTDVFSWRWIFFMNVPITAVAMFVTARVVTETRGDDTTHSIDVLGVATLSVALVSLQLALDQGATAGFGDLPILALFALAVLSAIAFVFVEKARGANALVPPDVLRNRVFAMACLSVLLMSAIFFSALLYLPQFMSKELGYSAVRAGAGLLPMMVVFAATSFVAGALYQRLGAKLIVSIGALCLAVGIFMLSFVGDTYRSIVPGMLVLGVGVGLFYSSITTAAVTALDPSRSSLAGGIVYMCQIAGGAIGLGVNTAIVVSAGELTDGISTAFRLDAALAVVGLVIAVAFIGSNRVVPHFHVTRWLHRAHA